MTAILRDESLREVWLDGPQYRIIPTRFPPINFFERYTPPELMDAAFEIESMTNERLREETGELHRIATEDRVSGPGASIVMAAFAHIGNPSRFTDGQFGIYYCGRELETAIRETVFHRERFLAATQQTACEIEMRVYKGTLEKPLLDVRGVEFAHLLNPDPAAYAVSQQFGARIKQSNAWGLVFPSVRNPLGQCIAAFRPPA
ncbi:MAG TPA: RES family NAD+ phosphorylase, partial [Dongiaceae bacterium]|nr:RES family NAD+ phosphorylase [Dongiaceae bacterium]